MTIINQKPEIMKKEEITINGMSCRHCAMAVKTELQKLGNVTVIDVQIGKAVVDYDETKTTRQQIEQAILTAGYQPV
jgi:copper chaperone CopZ